MGFTHFSSRAVIEPTSSGADQRTEPPLAAFEPLTEYMSSAIEERPKFARQGIPSPLIRILYYKNGNRTPIVMSQIFGAWYGGKEPHEHLSSHRGRLYGYAGSSDRG